MPDLLPFTINSLTRWQQRPYAIMSKTNHQPDETFLARIGRQQEALLAIIKTWREYEGNIKRIMRDTTEIASRALEVERVSVWYYDHTQRSLWCDDLYEAGPNRHSHGREISADQHPAYFMAIETEEVIAAENAITDTHTREFAESYLIPNGIGAILDALIRVEGKLAGVLCFEHTSGKRKFHADEINTARYLASMLSAAIEFQLRVEDSRRIEGLLRDEVALWGILFDQSRDGIVVLKQDGSVYQTNRQFADMLGYSLEEINELHIWNWDCQFDKNAVLEMTRTIDSSGDHFETKYRCRDGSIIDVELSTNATIYKGEKLIFCICRNITERKQFQEQLNLHRIIVENSNTIVFRWRVDPGWTTELVSENVQQFGYKADDLRSGAVAYSTLIHPDDLERVAAEVKHYDESGAESFEQEYRIVCADGRVRWVYDRTVVERNDDGHAHHYQGTVIDITERKEAEKRIHVLATTDGLTGILNRKEFTRLLESEIDRVNRYGTQLSLIMYDLDHFKKINDTHGHDAGDEVIQTVVKLVCSNIRSVDIAARWGGEEFMVLLPQSSLEAARKIADKLRLTVSGHDFGKPGPVTASFGVVEFAQGEDSNSLLKRVDKALYLAKNNGRNRVESIPFEAD